MSNFTYKGKMSKLISANVAYMAEHLVSLPFYF